MQITCSSAPLSVIVHCYALLKLAPLCCCFCCTPPPPQVFVEGKAGQTGDDLERELFIARKLVERAKVAAMGEAAADFYICTLSNRTIVYKVSDSSCSRLHWLQGMPSWASL